MKQERLKRKADDASEILSWVSISRKLEEKRNMEMEKAACISKNLDEQVKNLVCWYFLLIACWLCTKLLILLNFFRIM